ncbi:MAG: hypothetical protein M3N08_10605 [Pseudomonadota bacterium]|nr:hypothetical protein [Pseudomonadota bacterium]
MADQRQKRQASGAGAEAAFMVALALALLLTGCGKKPSTVDPPPYVTEDHFPQLYPDPATDPKP